METYTISQLEKEQDIAKKHLDELNERRKEQEEKRGISDLRQLIADHDWLYKLMDAAEYKMRFHGRWAEYYKVNENPLSYQEARKVNSYTTLMIAASNLILQMEEPLK